MLKKDILDFHKSTFVIDAHCDTVSLLEKEEYDFAVRNKTGHMDLPRLQEGEVNLQVFAIYQEEHYKPGGALKRTLLLLSKFKEAVSRNSDKISLVKEYGEIAEIVNANKIAALLSLEGGDALEGEVELLEIFFSLGVRMLGLTWNNRNFLADGVAEEGTGGGLTVAGRKIIKLCNSKKILVDLAHISSQGYKEAIALSYKPVVVSHANSRQLCAHRRNLTDEQLKLLKENGGVIGISFCPYFIKEKNPAMEDLLNHFTYIADLIGVDYIGLGSDFDGIDITLPTLNSTAGLPTLTAGLFQKGFSKEEVAKILGGNFLRVLQETI